MYCICISTFIDVKLLHDVCLGHSFWGIILHSSPNFTSFLLNLLIPSLEFPAAFTTLLTEYTHSSLFHRRRLKEMTHLQNLYELPML